MRELWAVYLAEPRTESAGTIERRHFWANFFAERLTSWPPTRAQIEALFWQPKADGKFYSSHTVNQGLTMLRQFFTWAVAHGHLARSPFDGWLIRKATSRAGKLLTRSQLDAIFGTPGSDPIGLRNRAILHLVAELGLSSRRLANLDLDALQLDRCCIASRRFSAAVAEHLHRYLKHGRPALLVDPVEPSLFLTQHGRRPKPITIRLILTAAAGQAIGNRDLHRSWLAHRDAFHSRRLPGI